VAPILGLVELQMWGERTRGFSGQPELSRCFSENVTQLEADIGSRECHFHKYIAFRARVTVSAHLNVFSYRETVFP
jgi:hypothetical protein